MDMIIDGSDGTPKRYKFVWQPLDAVRKRDAMPMLRSDSRRRQMEGLKLHYQYKEWEALLHKLNELPYWPETG